MAKTISGYASNSFLASLPTYVYFFISSLTANIMTSHTSHTITLRDRGKHIHAASQCLVTHRLSLFGYGGCGSFSGWYGVGSDGGGSVVGNGADLGVKIQFSLF